MPDAPDDGRFVPPPGFEPGTCRVETGCSIQLSYGGVPPGYAAPRTALRTLGPPFRLAGTPTLCPMLLTLMVAVAQLG